MPRPALRLALLVLVCAALSPRLLAADLHVAPDGFADAAGTLAAPTTLERALSLVAPGDTIYLRGGHHAFSAQITIAKENSGTPEARKRLVAYDAPPGAGENADGFACKLTTGPGNVFRGCVAHHNIDDGWDLYTKARTRAIGAVVLDQCVAYANGAPSDGAQSAKGDRNGFKLGGSKIPVPHVVTRCIAFANGKNGFTWNSNPGAIRLVNNLAWDNAQGNFKFESPEAIFLNNLSFFTTGPGKSDRYGGPSGAPTGPSNIFSSTAGKTRPRSDCGLVVAAADFVSLAAPADGDFPRAADGSLAFGDFARLAPGSPLIDAGALPPPELHAELPFAPTDAYVGPPDLGARETPHTASVVTAATH